MLTVAASIWSSTRAARSFFAESKRVSNRLVKDELGYRFIYPTYREGLKTLLKGRQ